MASKRFADLANLKTLFAGLKAKFEPKDSTIVKDGSYVHTDNNLTSALLTKLNGIATGAQVNVIEKVAVNDTEQTVTSKKVNITVAEGTANGTIKVAGTDVAVHGLGTASTANVESTLTNGSNLPTGAAVKSFVEGKGYQTAAEVSGILSSGGYATESFVTTAIGNANHLQATQVTTLPATGQTNYLYLVPDDGGKSNKDMYIWDASGSKFVLVGNTEVDLTGYAQESQFSVATTAQIQALFA